MSEPTPEGVAAYKRAMDAWASCTHKRGQPPCINCVTDAIRAAEVAVAARARAGALEEAAAKIEGIYLGPDAEKQRLAAAIRRLAEGG